MCVCVCVLSSPLSTQTTPGPTYPSYCLTNTKQIVCKGRGAACAGSSPMTRGKSVWWPWIVSRPAESKGTEFVWKFKCLLPLRHFEFWFACGLVFKGRGQERRRSRQRCETPYRGHLLLNYSCLSCCYCSSFTYLLRHSLASHGARLALTGSSPDSFRWNSGTFKHSTVTRFSNSVRTD